MQLKILYKYLVWIKNKSGPETEPLGNSKLVVVYRKEKKIEASYFEKNLSLGLSTLQGRNTFSDE